MTERLSSEIVSTRLQRIAELARQAPEMVLTTLAHHIDMDFLKEAYKRTRKDGAAGVDGQDAEDYAKDLETNLQSLLNRFKSGTYKAPPVRRAYIPKGDGTDRQRPLGIPTFEDKLLQKSVSMVLVAVYEQEFFPCSYAYRPKRGQHQALQSVWDAVMSMGGGWVLEVDIQDFFGTLDWKHLRSFLDRRVQDGVIRKAIDKWLKAGIMEEGKIEYPEDGTPQGGVVSPILANTYLHEVMDKWFDETVKSHMRSEVHMVRFADDIILIFKEETDARRVLEVLPKRFAKYGLTLHPTKTRLLEFRRPKWTDKRGDGSFDFLGFTHYWDKSRKGYWVVRRKTASKRLRRCLRAITEWCQENRHERLCDQHQSLKRKLHGHYNYYGITGNYDCLATFLYLVRRTWFKWLNRRSEKKSLTWNHFAKILRILPLPVPRIRRSVLAAKPTT